MFFRMCVFATTLAVFSAAPAIGQDKPAVAVKLAKLPELAKIIQSHKGKVVVVDVWSTT